MQQNEIHHGDCLSLMDDVPDASIDLVLCDLPYGTTKCKWDTILPFDSLWKQYNRVCKPNAAIVLFGAESFSSLLRTSNLSDYRYDWYWNKRRAANWLFMNKQPGRVIETISVFYRNQPTYNPQKIPNLKGVCTRNHGKNPQRFTGAGLRDVMGNHQRDLSYLNDGSGKNYEPDKLLPSTLLEFSKDTRSRLHPTQKPVKLLEYLIRTYTNEGETVLDNCCGSGSTGIAAINTRRKYVLMEKDPEYYRIASERLQKSTSIFDE